MRAEVVFENGQAYVEIDGVRVVGAKAIEWRGLQVIAEIDPAIRQASGKNVFHLSVGGGDRRATDAEVQEAIDEWVPKKMRLLEFPSVVNPFVRHFFEADAL